VLNRSKFALSALCLGLILLTAQPALSQTAAPAARAAGTVLTPQKLPVPGATVRVVHLETGRGWVTWTDENGKFDMPGLPPGRVRIEAQQLGFEPATLVSELKPDSPTELSLTLRVAPLPAPPAPAQPPAPAHPPAAAAPPPPPRPGAATPPAPRPGQPGQMSPQMAEMMRQRMGQQGAFQQVDPSAALAAALPDQPVVTNNVANIDTGPLGEASSSDAFLMSGTVSRGATAGGDFSMGFGNFFGGMGGMMMGPGGMMMGPGGMIFGGAGAGGMQFPGAGGPPGGMPEGGMQIIIAGPGGPPPGGRGQPGAGGQRQPGQQRAGQQAPGRGAQAGRGQAPGGRPGEVQIQAGGFGGGMEALWGVQRLLRLAVNRVRVGFYNRYGTSAWDARPYALTGESRPKVASYRELFGVNIGGPLRIPKIYDGREKTFFFFNYDLARNRNPVDTFSTVPLPEERQGNFCARGLQLYDPASNLSGPRTPFGCQIPASRLDPAAQGLLQFIPLPNLPGTVQNFHLQTRVPQSTDRLNVRVLHTINQRLSLQVAYGLNSSRSQSVQGLPELRGKQDVLGQNVNIGLTQQWTQRLTHDTRINWSRNAVDSLNRFAYNTDIAGTLGITGISSDPINYGVPAINFTNFTDLNDPVPALRRNQTFRFTDNFSYSRSRHTFRTGLEIRRQQNNSVNDPIARGQFTFTGLLTSQLDSQGRPLPGTGYDFADFLLGLPQSTNVRYGSSRTYFRSWGFSWFAQDDWRVHPRFSVSLGVRYEAATPPIELFNRLANLDLNSDITAVAVVVPYQHAPFSGRLPRSLIRGDFNNWAPRIGLAWRPKIKNWNRNLVVRAGYSIFYNSSIYGQLSASLANQPPHAFAQTRLTSSATLLTLQNGFPPVAPGDVPNTIAVDPNYRVGYAQIWNLTVESQLTQTISLDLTYTGTKGTHLDLLRSPNRAVPSDPLRTELSRRIPNAPGFTYDTSGASSIYHALQIGVRRRMARGLMVFGSYTFGKSIDNASSIGGGAQVVVQDDSNFAAERGLSSFDIRHQFRANYVYELPFGERKRWASKGTPAAILGNWTLNGGVVIATGTPYTARLLGNAANNSGTGNNFSERPDQVADASLPRDQRTTMRWFNTEAFVQPPFGRFGNAARNTIPGPGQIVFNMSLGKNIRIGRDGQRRLDLRWEANNLFNTPNFTGLGTALGSSNYGRVLGTRAMRTMELNIRFNF
jgi:hypothetical protein